ncbi:Hgsnat [Columba guinea]|nr:Hgsnat [Columba guinea]
MPQDAAARPEERKDCIPAARLQASGLSLQPSAHRDGLRLAQQCLYQFLAFVPPSNGSERKPGTATVMLDTQHPLTLLLNGSVADGELCKIQYHFGEFGNYSLVVKTLNTSTKSVSCVLVINEGPINSYLPILFAFLVYMGILAILIVGRLFMKIDPVRNWVYKKLNPRETDRLINSEPGSPNAADPVSGDPAPQLWSSAPRQRLRSLDTFRGLSLIIMVFVNYGGGKYWFFKHESWNGLTVADLVFPWFVFIMGTSISLSLSSMLRQGSSKWKVLGKILWRSFLLILLGIIVVNPNYCLGPLSWENLRIPGVLQRLGLTYLVVAALELLFTRAGAESGTLETPCPALRDILPYWQQWIFVLVLEVLWLCLTFLLPVPGCPRENVEELVCWANKSAVIRLEQSNSLCRNLCVSVPGAISVLEALETSETMPTALEERLVTSIVCFLGINISISIPLQMYVALGLQGEAAGQD